MIEVVEVLLVIDLVFIGIGVFFFGCLLLISIWHVLSLSLFKPKPSLRSNDFYLWRDSSKER